MIPEGYLAVLAYKDGVEIGVHLLEKTTPLEIDDIELTYLSDLQYSGFQVKSDPGNVLVWVACSLFLIGLVMVFYFPHSQIWVLIRNTSPGSCRLFIRVMSLRAFNSAMTLSEIQSEIENSFNEDDNKIQQGVQNG